MSKRITLFIILIVCFFKLEAQVEKGDKFLGGGISFSYNSFETLDGNNINTAQPNSTLVFNGFPQIGFLVNDFIAVGGELNYSFTKTKRQFFSNLETNTFTSIQNIYGVSPFAKVYWKLAKKAGFTLDAKAGIGFGKQKNKIDLSGVAFVGDDIFQVDFDIRPQFYYFITPRIGVEASFGGLYYQYQQLKTDDSSFEQTERNQTNFSSTFGSNLFLSFKYYFGKRFAK